MSSESEISVGKPRGGVSNMPSIFGVDKLINTNAKPSFGGKKKPSKYEVESDSSVSDYSDDSSESGSSGSSGSYTSGSSGSSVSERAPRLSSAEKTNLKYLMLTKMGSGLNRAKYPYIPHVSEADTYEKVKMAFDQWQHMVNRDQAVSLQKNIVGGGVQAIEYASTKLFPGYLDFEGWYEAFAPKLADPKNDEIFEELHEKYGSMFGGVKAPPEIRLLMLIGSSGLMFQFGKAMCAKSNVPDLHSIMRKNPDIGRLIAQEMNNGDRPQAPTAASQNFDLAASLRKARENALNMEGSAGRLNNTTPSTVSGIARSRSATGHVTAEL